MMIILPLYDMLIYFDTLPVERGFKALAEVPVSNRAEYLGQCFIIKGINWDDIQVAGEAA